jgi:hypothetical protein
MNHLENIVKNGDLIQEIWGVWKGDSNSQWSWEEAESSITAFSPLYSLALSVKIFESSKHFIPD